MEGSTTLEALVVARRTRVRAEQMTANAPLESTAGRSCFVTRSDKYFLRGSEQCRIAVCPLRGATEYLQNGSAELRSGWCGLAGSNSASSQSSSRDVFLCFVCKVRLCSSASSSVFSLFSRSTLRALSLHSLLSSLTSLLSQHLALASQIPELVSQPSCF